MTLYSDIYDLYSGMVSDWEILSLPEQDQDEILEGWLLTAIGTFRTCKTDLSDRDSITKQFNLVLADTEKVILAKLMIVEWLSPKLYNLELLRNNLNSKDFTMYSPASFLKEMRSTQEGARSIANRLITTYGYASIDVSKL